MVIPRSLILLAIAGFVISTSRPVNAQEGSKDGPVYVDPQQVDSDYALQGEFRGWQFTGDGQETRSAGLQVVAERTAVLVPAGPAFLTRLGHAVEDWLPESVLRVIALRRMFLCVCDKSPSA